MSRRQEAPQGYYSHPTKSAFPPTGKEGFKYRAEYTKEMFIFIGGVYEPYGGPSTGPGGGIPEAPMTGGPFVRSGGTWTEIPHMSNAEIQTILDNI